MNDHLAPLRGLDDVLPVHGVPAQPRHAVALFGGSAQAAAQGSYLPAGVAQLAGDFAADAAAGTQYKGALR